MSRARFEGGGLDRYGQGWDVLSYDPREVTPGDIEDEVLHRNAEGYWPTGHVEDRHPTRTGGQEFRFNPLGGRPIMTVDNEPTRVRGAIHTTYTGGMVGGADYRTYTRASDGRTVLEERNLHVKPDLSRIPIAGQVMRAFENNVPVFGAAARMMRNAAEDMVAPVLAGMHVVEVAGGAGDQLRKDIVARKKRKLL